MATRSTWPATSARRMARSRVSPTHLVQSHSVEGVAEVVRATSPQRGSIRRRCIGGRGERSIAPGWVGHRIERGEDGLMTVNNHDEQGKDVLEWVELVRAALPNADAAGSSRNWTKRWIQPGRPGTCGRSIMSSRPGIESCSPASTAVPDGRRPRRDCAAAKSRSGKPNRWTSRTRSPDTSAEPGRAAHCLVVHHQAQPEFSELATPIWAGPSGACASHSVLTRWPLLGQVAARCRANSAVPNADRAVPGRPDDLRRSVRTSGSSAQWRWSGSGVVTALGPLAAR
jgi:hypothetical protein